mmetsp:Transcript_21568/g.31362  ORF Transcript_21568/g.31362 Transcript_21568/m.31362 type:complete len:1172 (-) Transcript_21568:211-3726(-)|eukprot:CAMPEP_0185018162 /NCGR_PEP_ID=MMETSP1103-20130426/976_1 /TAXON_ID=36769 /ORGANISM="Paraphysomonas bandaiensis, Strain Caron Lab Isolate" /LENGTH=1171 /DNA_ID=CAMNT_0027547883 /DNA_START=64 /DNA_END=3579 /DNA_ORIENTATION=-
MIPSTMQKSDIAKTLDGKGEWGPFLVQILVFLVLISTLSFAVSTVDSLTPTYDPLFSGIECFCVIVFTIEYVMRLWVADSVLSWMFQPIAIVDLFSILPSWLDLIIPGDAFPALQFLRMLRLLKFLTASERGSAASTAFLSSWNENKSLIYAASFAGGAVWLVTASLQYFAERGNEDMEWCYPPDGVPSKHCTCDDDGCEGSSCICQNRFNSIPSAMFFVLLNLSGEYPLAENHSTLGRFVAVATAVISVGIFAIPTGLIGAALEGAVSALNTGKEEDYDVDDDDAAEIAAEAQALLHRAPSSTSSPVASVIMAPPPLTTKKAYKALTGSFICVSAFASVLSTMKSMPALGIFIFYLADIVCAVFFFVDHVLRILYAGPEATYKAMWCSLLPLADLMSWLPTVLYVLGGVVGCPAYIFLTISLFRMMKYERYSMGFQILSRVVSKSHGILAIGGMAASCCLVFCSALMYFAERNNPDPKMRSYYSSVPTAMWMTLLNLSGEAPLCDYTLVGRIIVGFLSIVAVAVFAVPVGALGAGFEGVISEIASGDKEDANEIQDGREEKSPSGKNRLNKPSGYGSIGGEVEMKQPDQTEQLPNPSSQDRSSHSSEELNWSQRLVEGRGTRGKMFQTISVCATLFAVTLEVISTCEFATNTGRALHIVSVLEMIVVVWFTLEYILRTSAHGFTYIFSWLGFVDFVSTFPWYLARGLFGPHLARLMDVYDGPLRAIRLLRLVRLDTYAPSISLVDDAFRDCWDGLSVSCYAGVVLWFLFNECLYFAERNDAEHSEDKRFRSALSSLQYSAVLLTGDYPIVDFSLWGKLCCVVAVVVAVGIVAVPASILAGAFVEILQAQAEKRRQTRYDAAVKCQRMFLARKARSGAMPGASARAFQMVVQDAITHSAVLRGLDSSNPPICARICIWKNRKSPSSTAYHTFVGALIALNILAVILESVPSIEETVPHAVWQAFETFSVIFFTVEYLTNCFTAVYDPKWNFQRSKFMTSFIGLADLLAIAPYYIQVIVIPIFFPTLVFDATVFRIFRLARILELEKFFKAFSLLDDVFVKAAPVLKATGVVALIVWVGGATLFYYLEPHSDDEDVEAAARGGEDAAVFVSIVDALYYCAIFLAGEWAVVDFTPLGSIVCTIMALIGVALFSIPVGVLFEGFQDMLAEQNSK